jgi:hypothetical protein
MSQQDLHTIVYPGTANQVAGMGLNFVSISTNSVHTGNTINTVGFEALEMLFVATSYTDGTFTLSFQDSPDGTNWTAVPAQFTLGLSSTQIITAANAPTWIGYIGKKQYVRLVVTSTNVTTGATVGAIALNAFPHFAPTDPNFVPAD